VADMREQKNAYGVFVGISETKEDSGMDERIILKRILKN
jgi:hypothetical protein